MSLNGPAMGHLSLQSSLSFQSNALSDIFSDVALISFITWNSDSLYLWLPSIDRNVPACKILVASFQADV